MNERNQHTGRASNKNLTQLYFQNAKRVPFVVRRWTWPDNCVAVITRVLPRKVGSSWYGEVYGFTVMDGVPNGWTWGAPGESVLVPNSGSYQWELVADLSTTSAAGGQNSTPAD